MGYIDSKLNFRNKAKDEFLKLSYENDLLVKHFHEEEACFSARFIKK